MSRRVGMADEADSKSVVGNHVRVQVPLPAFNGIPWEIKGFFCSPQTKPSDGGAGIWFWAGVHETKTEVAKRRTCEAGGFCEWKKQFRPIKQKRSARMRTRASWNMSHVRPHSAREFRKRNSSFWLGTEERPWYLNAVKVFMVFCCRGKRYWKGTVQWL